MIPLAAATYRRVRADRGHVCTGRLHASRHLSHVGSWRSSLAMSGAGWPRLHRYPSPLGRSRPSPGRPPRLSGGAQGPAERQAPARGGRARARGLAGSAGIAQESGANSTSIRGRRRCAGDTSFRSWRWRCSPAAARRRLNRGRWVRSGAPLRGACWSPTRLPGLRWALRATSPGASVFRPAAERATTHDTIVETRPGPRGRMSAAASCRLKAGPRPGTGEGSGCSRRS